MKRQTNLFISRIMRLPGGVGQAASFRTFVAPLAPVSWWPLSGMVSWGAGARINHTRNLVGPVSEDSNVLKHFFRPAAFAFLVLTASAVQAEAPSPEALAAAKDLVRTMNVTEQFKAILPVVINALKPAIVQGRPDVAKDYDALMPAVSAEFLTRVDEISDKIAGLYADNFSVDEIKAINAFYLTPAGQKVLQKTPALAAQTMSLGQEWGRSIGTDLKARLIEEMRKKGHTL
ncbi:MAG: DUF2059 domain-containing protein [Bradyrhizobiaceae bacterium]|nr:MAG: DUF2059 domain-containing protein [Bradyrhizobiaceae bacterium]